MTVEYSRKSWEHGLIWLPTTSKIRMVVWDVYYIMNVLQLYVFLFLHRIWNVPLPSVYYEVTVLNKHRFLSVRRCLHYLLEHLRPITHLLKSIFNKEIACRSKTWAAKMGVQRDSNVPPSCVNSWASCLAHLTKLTIGFSMSYMWAFLLQTIVY